jgi:hypothetical protein
MVPELIDAATKSIVAPLQMDESTMSTYTYGGNSMFALNELLHALSVNVTEYIPGIVVDISGFSKAIFEKCTAVSDAVHTPPL